MPETAPHGDGGSSSMQQSFKKSLESLATIFDFTERFFTREAIEPEHRFAVNFTVEELFTNMVKYSRESDNDVLLELERHDDRMVGTITDFGVQAFDVTQAPPANVDGPIEDREPGGLGLHLIPKMIDTLDYEYADGDSRITFTKALG